MVRIRPERRRWSESLAGERAIEALQVLRPELRQPHVAHRWVDAIVDSKGRAVLFPLLSQKYKVQARDTLKCEWVSDYLSILVKDGTLALPTAFTPNSSTNNKFMVRGNGIKRVVNLKIFNRWGEMLFETSDNSDGWDGTYKGSPQPIDTYVYTVTIETLQGTIVEKNGVFTLIR